MVFLAKTLTNGVKTLQFDAMLQDIPKKLWFHQFFLCFGWEVCEMWTKHYNLMPCCHKSWKKYVFISLLTLSLPVALCRYTISIAINKAMMSLILVGIDKKWKARPLAFQKCQSQCSEFQRSRANWHQMNVLSKILECSTEKITRKIFFFKIFKLCFLTYYGQ